MIRGRDADLRWAFPGQVEATLDVAKSGTSAERVRDIVSKSLYIQYDPLKTVAPSHFLVMFSRDGTLTYAHVQAATSLANGVIEAWTRVACFMTITDYSGLAPEFIRRREGSLRYGERRRVGAEIGRLATDALTVVASNGPITASGLDQEMGRRSQHFGSWKTSVSRTVLNYLWYRGYLVVVGRDSGQPRFDLCDRWISMPFDGSFDSDMHRSMLAEHTVRLLDNLAAGSAADVAWFLGQPVQTIRQVFGRLTSQGRISRITAARAPEYYASAYGIAMIETARARADTSAVRILSPFDPLLVHRDRFELLTGIRFRSDLFTPAVRRGPAYYPLILLVGYRPSKIVWLKANRSRGRLEVAGVKKLAGVEQFSRDETDAIQSLAAYLELSVPRVLTVQR